MKITLISDTHSKHNQLTLPKGDILIHAGDVSSRGNKREVKNFLNWFSKQDYKYKIFIAGNHDFFFEQENENIIQEIIPENIIYLNDSGIEIEGIKIWGSPIQPTFFDWAFNRERGTEIKKYWDLIPNDTDILITHGPPFGILDQTVRGENVGCKELLIRVLEIKPKIHVFGHIHEAYGEAQKHDIKFINASVLNVRYQVTNLSVEVDFDKRVRKKY